jgi:ATP-dependent exoDNAse (exonuclease V) alpha subunit
LYYTAFTRAKKELHIVDPRDFNKAYTIWQTKHFINK